MKVHDKHNFNIHNEQIILINLHQKMSHQHQNVTFLKIQTIHIFRQLHSGPIFTNTNIFAYKL